MTNRKSINRNGPFDVTTIRIEQFTRQEKKSLAVNWICINMSAVCVGEWVDECVVYACVYFANIAVKLKMRLLLSS